MVAPTTSSMVLLLLSLSVLQPVGCARVKQQVRKTKALANDKAAADVAKEQLSTTNDAIDGTDENLANEEAAAYDAEEYLLTTDDAIDGTDEDMDEAMDKIGLTSDAQKVDHISNATALHFFQSVDRTGSGVIHFVEWNYWLAKKAHVSDELHQMIKDTYAEMDVDRDNAVTQEEFMTWFTSAHPTSTTENPVTNGDVFFSHKEIAEAFVEDYGKHGLVDELFKNRKHISYAKFFMYLKALKKLNKAAGLSSKGKVTDAENIKWVSWWTKLDDAKGKRGYLDREQAAEAFDLWEADKKVVVPTPSRRPRRRLRRSWLKKSSSLVDVTLVDQHKLSNNADQQLSTTDDAIDGTDEELANEEATADDAEEQMKADQEVDQATETDQEEVDPEMEIRRQNAFRGLIAKCGKKPVVRREDEAWISRVKVGLPKSQIITMLTSGHGTKKAKFPNDNEEAEKYYEKVSKWVNIRKCWREYEAHQNNNENKVEKYEYGHAVDDRNSNNMTKLLMAAYSGHKQCSWVQVEGLLRDGADMEARDSNGYTPLMWAANNGHLKCVKELFSKDAKLEAKSYLGETALLLAAREGKSKVVKYLKQKHANLEVTDTGREGYTPLMWATNKGHLEVVEQLTSDDPPGVKAELEARSPEGQTALAMAAKWHKLEILRSLAALKANLEAEERSKKTPLILAIPFGLKGTKEAMKIVRELAQRKANLDAQDGKGKTALHFAARVNNKDIVQELLGLGADSLVKDSRGKTPYDQAEEYYYKGDELQFNELVKLLYTRNFKEKKAQFEREHTHGF